MSIINVRPEIRLSVTPECNVKPRCSYCFGEGKGLTGEISISQAEYLGRLANELGLPHVHITGGEPLLRSGICDVIYTLKDAGVENVALTTNGLLLTEGLLPEMRRKGLDEMHLHYRMHSPPSERLIQLVSYAKDIGILIRFNCPVSDINAIPIVLDTVYHNKLDVAMIEVIEPITEYHIGREEIEREFHKWLKVKGLGARPTENPNEFGDFYAIGDEKINILPTNHDCIRALSSEEFECPSKIYDSRFWISGDGERFYASDCMYKTAKPVDSNLKGVLSRKYGR